MTFLLAISRVAGVFGVLDIIVLSLARASIDLLGIALSRLLLDLATQVCKKHRHLGESAQAESVPPY